MKVFTVGNKSFVTSFQLAGVPGIISETPQKAMDEIRKLTDDSDVGLADNISMISSTGMVDENILLTHGHTMPSENFSHVDKIIMGHIHPVFFLEDSVINGQRVWISMKTEKENIFPNKSGELEIIVIPSFNKYFYATHRKQYKKSISPIINKIKSISSAKIITLDGVIIGDESIIDQVI